MSDAAAGETTSLEAVVVHTIFSNEENAFSVVRCTGPRGSRFTATGALVGIQDGDRVRLTGRWVRHPKFGKQLEVSSCLQVHPSTIEGIRRFLASRRVKGIGPRLAERMVEAFGLETLDVIEHHPERLSDIPGIGRRSAAKIAEGWSEHRGIQQVMVFLAGHGVQPGIAVKVFKRYKAKALAVVRENPYRLAEEIYGVGFLTADRIARSLGISADAAERFEAGLMYALSQAGLEGHVFLPANELLSQAARLLGTDTRSVSDARDDPLIQALRRLEERRRVIVYHRAPDAPAVFTPRMDRAETQVARALGRPRSKIKTAELESMQRAMAELEQRASIRLAELQRDALVAALTEPIVVITGGPGTGKTTLIRGITSILGQKRQEVLLAAPTGRAAKRLSETTGCEARTIHRLLEFNPAAGSFQRDADRPLEADLVVVDEVSMLDIELAASLLEAIPAGCRLVLVGDADQLPSVGPGNVLADIIASDVVPVIRLDQIFRQAEQSKIITNAHRINHGQMPELDAGSELGDFYFISRADPQAAADTAIEVVTQRIPTRFGLDPIDEIQVLAPMHRGELGVTSLNERLQELLTPPGPEIRVGAHRFRIGDKVMQVRNSYDLDVFNGDIGRISHVDPEERTLTAIFDRRPVEIGPDGLDDLMPAYACTIHKSQGSEYPAVVILLHQQHHIMLQRNLVYTAVTRGKRLVVIIGSPTALRRAVSNATVRHRHTLLAERLRSTVDRQPADSRLPAGT